MNTVTKLRELLEKAGKYPALEPVGSRGTRYTCPVCQGEGDIDDEFVKEGQVTSGEGLDISIVGVQVFGFGDGMEAMDKLIPTALHALPALLDVAEAAKEVERCQLDLTIPDDVEGEKWKKLREALARLGEA